MKSGYKIQWTNHALSELKDIIEYLEENWTDREIKIFSKELDHTLELISKNPELFQISRQKRTVRRAVVAKFNNLYYRKKDGIIEILSLFSNRQNPDNVKL